MKNVYKNKSFFAAANGYSGFRSYFGSVFNSAEYKKIYTLKGGPGTGKSTMMKKIRDYFLNKTDTETVLCSSDINSLDGIIIKNKSGKCAVLDGTAPHERDAVIPGAIDSLIDLGAGFKTDRLKERRELIEALNKRKKQYYSLAYHSLSIAGKAAMIKAELVEKAIDTKKLSRFCKKMFDDSLIPTAMHEETRLYSCFGKEGYRRLTNKEIRVVSFKGNCGCAYKVIDELCRLYRSLHGIDVIIPSPFSGEINEGFCVSGTCFTIGDENESIDSSQILKPTDDEDEAFIKKLDTIINELHKESQDYFYLASNEHFKLEDIYREAVDFTNNDRVYATIIDDFEHILEI